MCAWLDLRVSIHWKNLRLDDISPIIATGNNMLQTDVNCQPYFVTRDGDTMTFQIHHRDTRTDTNTNNLRAAKIELKQVGNDIQAKLLGNKTYKPCSLGYFIGLGWDVFDNPPESFGENSGTRSDYTSDNIFSIKRLEVGPRCETYIYTNGLLTTSFDTVVAKNVRVEDLEVLYCASGYKHKIGGWSYVRSDRNQELYNSAYGNAIFESTGGADGFSRKSGFSSYSNYYEDGTANNGWGVKSLTVTGPRGYKVTAGGANTMTDSSFVVKSDGKNKIVYDVATKYALPPAIDCYGNATLNFSAAGGANDGAGKGTDAITMHEGTMLRTTVDYPFQYNQTKVVLDGATMIGDGSGKVYLSYMTLMNGAEIVRNSSDYRIGWSAPSPVWTVTGTGRSVYSGELQLWGTNGGTKDTTIEVGETAEGADFLLDGDLAQSSDSRYPSAALIKTGVGTMEVTGTITLTTRGLYLKEGTLLLSKNNGLAAGTFFTMEGGTLALAANVADACASMSVTEDSVLDLAAGATLTLDAITVVTDKKLNITAADTAKVKVNARLDAATLSRIRLNGRRVAQGNDGYLGTPGFTLVVL